MESAPEQTISLGRWDATNNMAKMRAGLEHNRLTFGKPPVDDHLIAGGPAERRHRPQLEHGVNAGSFDQRRIVDSSRLTARPAAT